MDNLKNKSKKELIDEIDILKQEIRKLKKDISSNFFLPLKDLNDDDFTVISGQETDAIFKGDQNGNFIMVNDFATKLTGYSEKELLSMNIRALFNPEILNKNPLRFDQVLSGEKVNNKRELTRKDGTQVIIEMSSKRLSDNTLICFMQDVSEEHQLNQALIESENRYKLVIEAAEEGVWEWELQSDIVYYSDKWKAQVGYMPHELEDKFSTWQKLLHSEDKERMFSEVQNYIKNPVKHFIAEFRLKHKDGTYRWIRNKATSVLNERGEVLRMVGAHTDITKEINAKNELIESEKKYRLLFELLPYGGEVIDKNGYISEISSGTSKMLGYSAEEMTGKHFSNFISPEDFVFFKQNFFRLLRGKKQIGEMCLIKNDGTKLNVIRAGQPIFNENGEVEAVLSLSVDITERKMIEKELYEKNNAIKAKNEEYIIINNKLKTAVEIAEENENRLLTFINAIPDIVCFKDADGKWLLANDADLELFQLKNKDYKGKTDLELAEQTHEIYKETFLSCHRSDINTWEKGTISKEIEVIPTVFGEKKIFDVYKIPVYYPDGKRKGLATIGRDITELQETQEKLIAAKEMAEESNKLKSAFLANMSHEIRTPMNGIIGFSQLLNTPDISKQKIKEYSDIITLSGKHLLNIIDDIIEIAKIDSGQIRMVKKTMNVNKVFYELFNFYNSNDIKKSNKKVDLRFYITLKDDEVNILSDETKFKQILTNLINNAIKFTDKGYIEFGYYKEIDRLIFYVKDTGIGIHSSKYGMIFERFTQANSNTEKLYGGTGLGLAISKAYVKLLEGSIYLDSEPQKGSTFYFSLPYEITETLTEKKSDIIDYELKGNNRIVLIVEDNEINIEYITELLSGMSLRFFAVRTSLEAIDFVKSQKPDLILMDIKLPDNDGNYTLKEIKKLYPDIPVIVQSAFAFENDKLKSFEAGCDDYIVKPIKKIELINKMKKYLKN